MKTRVDAVKEILAEEEKSFAKTLDRGEKLFDGMLQKALASPEKVIAGEDAFRLYDTYGFPIDLTRLMAAERGVSVDEVAFAREQARGKELSRAKKERGATEKPILDVHMIASLNTEKKVPVTRDEFKYESGDIVSKILALVTPSKKFVTSSTEVDDKSKPLGVLLDRTNFYAESGGQEADRGTLTVEPESGKVDTGAAFEVDDVQVYGGYVLHVGTLKYGQLKVGDSINCSFDETRRWPLRNNHTATHILNYALKKVAGEEVDQKGSLVAQDKFRFDFSCRNALNVKQLDEIEQICSEFIIKNYPVYSREVPLAKAKAIRGLRAVFGEVYPDPVRVVSVKFPIDDLLKNPSDPAWETSSIEFCGGTHVGKTGDIRNFAILEETSIAKGIRRIIAVTGD